MYAILRSLEFLSLTSAIFVQVFSNALTFGAVPSAIYHAGASVEFVESTSAYVIDVDHFEKKCRECPDVRFLLISHMRGKLADMDGVERVCKKYNITLIEDCAHSLGVFWDGEHSGHKGVAACISTQAYKLLNSGEGGFLLTDDPVSGAEHFSICTVNAVSLHILNACSFQICMFLCLNWRSPVASHATSCHYRQF